MNSKIIIPEYIKRSIEHGTPIACEYFACNNGLEAIQQRNEFINDCGFVIVTEELLQVCKKIFGDNQVLEVMSGNGYFSSLLQDYGVKVIPTDNKSWSSREYYKKWKQEKIKITQCDALEAIDRFHNDVKFVIIAWPPYDEPIAAEVAEKCIEYKLDMLYIGEDWGGCTADDNFFDIIDDFEQINLEDEFNFKYYRFYGIYDFPRLIKFSKGIIKKD